MLVKGNAKYTWPKKKIEKDSNKMEYSGINLGFKIALLLKWHL